ncbi:MAG: metal-sulfur cluster assembly factor [Deltaproteobacteria bacterium]
MGLLSRLFGIEEKKKADDKKRPAPEKPKSDITPPLIKSASVSDSEKNRGSDSPSSKPVNTPKPAEVAEPLPDASSKTEISKAAQSPKTENIYHLDIIADDGSGADKMNIGRVKMTNQTENKNAFAPPEAVQEAKILEVLSDVYDPEIPIDIVNLGLIYGVEVQGGRVVVKMTMTAPGCPSSAQMAAEAKALIEELPGVREAAIEIVWEPPWDPSRMSEDAKQSLGYV